MALEFCCRSAGDVRGVLVPTRLLLRFLTSLLWGQLRGWGEEDGKEVRRGVNMFLPDHNFVNVLLTFCAWQLLQAKHS